MKQIYLTEICRPKQWKTISTADLHDTGYPVYGANGKIGFYDKYTHEFPTVLITCRGATCGSINISDPKSYVNGNAMALDNLSENYSLKYLYYILIARGLKDVVSGSAQPQITGENLSKVKIPNPLFQTQQKIAAILDKANELRQYNKQLIEKYDALTQSLFLDMFGDIKSNSKKWDLKPFDYFAKFDTKMTSDFEKYANKPHIGIANIEKETGKLVDYKLISEENLSSGKYIFDESHIIYSKIRPKLNKVALPNFSGLCSADSYPLKVIKENANRIFFAYVLRSDSFVDFILTHSTRTNIPKANKEQMKKYIGIAPPINLQNQFAERVQIIEAQKQQAQEALAKSELLFQGLLQQSFKGELN